MISFNSGDSKSTASLTQKYLRVDLVTPSRQYIGGTVDVTRLCSTCFRIRVVIFVFEWVSYERLESNSNHVPQASQTVFAVVHTLEDIDESYEYLESHVKEVLVRKDRVDWT